MNNSCTQNNTFPQNNTSHLRIEGWLYIPVFLVGLLLNMAALRIFLVKRARWTCTHIFMLNLSIADFALILYLPFRIYEALHLLKKTYFCTVLISIHYVNMYASIFTVTTISVHRYLAVKFPFQMSTWQTKKMALKVCVAIWVVVVTLSALYSKDNHPDNLSTCFERCKPMHVGLLVILEVFGYLVPLIVIMLCSIQTIMVVRKEDDKEDTTLAKKNIVGIVTANLIVFVVCFTPIHLGFLLRYLYLTNEAVHSFWVISEFIATTNCALDSISYYFLFKRFYAGTPQETISLSCHSTFVQGS